jgi:hypothetical protein
MERIPISIIENAPRHCSLRASLYVVFFLRSAHRFFIANDRRLLPSGVRPPRFFAFNAGRRGVVTLGFLTARGGVVPSSSAMARLRRSLCCFRSATILSRSKVHSSPVIDIHEAHYKMLLSSNQGHQKEPPSKLRTRCSNSNHIPSNWATVLPDTVTSPKPTTAARAWRQDTVAASR